MVGSGDGPPMRCFTSQMSGALHGSVLTACTVVLLSSFGAPAGAVAKPAAAETESAFQRGLVALHNFEYEQAVDAFRAARAADPTYAMAYWGEAMAYWQTLWRRENVDAARQV